MNNLLTLTRQARDEFDFDVADCRKFAKYVSMEQTDFEVCGVRFIDGDEIDSIMADELSNDEYILGCFNAGFLASVLNIDSDVIGAMQKADAYDAIGKLVLSLGKLDALQKAYASADGYGHHFNSWDGSEIEIFGRGIMFHAFDNKG